jgi:hypothetical protein
MSGVCKRLNLAIAALVTIAASTSFAAESGKYFDHAVIVIFENTNYADVIKQPFFKQLADGGASFSNFLALAHPSQGNYIALTSGSLNGVTGDGTYNLNVQNMADLLEAKGLTWKAYVENWPGNCSTVASKGEYARKHNPFISYVNIQNSPTRCANIVDATQFVTDLAKGTLADYAFYVPNLLDDAHDTNVAYADNWYSTTFGPVIANPSYMNRLALISTFDESGLSAKNQIYTSVYGPTVNPKLYPDNVNTLSLLRMIEDNWSLGNFGKSDVSAPAMPDIWK